MRVLIIMVIFIFISCGQSSEGKAKEAIAKSLGMEENELDNKTYYHFEVNSGELEGKTFMTPSYVQTTNGFRYDGDSKIELMDITFMDPKQGNSSFKIKFSDETAQPLNTEVGSEFILCIENNGKKYTLKSKSGSIKVNEFIDNKASFDDSRGSFADERRLALDFDGIFVDQTSNEEVNVKGNLQFVSNY